MSRSKPEALTHEQEVEFTEAFKLFDRDEDGLINPKELILLIRSLERNSSDQEIQLLIDQIVDTGNKLIDCTQFLRIMSILEKTQEINERRGLREIFNAIDTDNNGLIDSEELRAAMRVFMTAPDDVKLTKEEADQMIAEVDGDKDGRLTFEEFARIFAGQI